MDGLMWGLRGQWSPGATVSLSSVQLNLSILEALFTCSEDRASPGLSQLSVTLSPSSFLRQIIHTRETTVVFMKSVSPHAPSVHLPLNCCSSLSQVLMCKRVKTSCTAGNESLTQTRVSLSASMLPVIGAAVSAVLLLLSVLIIIFLLKRRQKQRNKETQSKSSFTKGNRLELYKSRGGKSTKIFYSSKSTITLLKFYLSTSKSTSLKIYSSKSKK